MKTRHVVPIAMMVGVVLAGNPTRAEDSGSASHPASPASGIALVELYTSEGCSSCPPADALLERLVRGAQSTGQRVYGLSMHVDYWDRLGWKDRFSSQVYSIRQEDYAHRFELPSLYTPQMVVNGTEQFVGSNEGAVRGAIDGALSRPSTVIPGLALTVSGTEIRARCSVAQAPRGATLNVAWVQSRAVSEPNRGENGGRTLRHVNVVRDFQTVKLRPGFDDVLTLHRPEVQDGEVIAWVQAANAGPVLGATSHLVRAGAPVRETPSAGGAR